MLLLDEPLIGKILYPSSASTSFMMSKEDEVSVFISACSVVFAYLSVSGLYLQMLLSPYGYLQKLQALLLGFLVVLTYMM